MWPYADPDHLDGGADEVPDFYLQANRELNFDAPDLRNVYPIGGRRSMLFGEMIANSVAEADERSRRSREMWKRRREQEAQDETD